MLESRALVVCGTDTGVGKTVVACGLTRALVDSGRATLAIKPVESGCSGAPQSTEDGVLLAQASRQREPQAALLRLRAPLAPPVAADQEGLSVDLEALCDRLRGYARDGQVLVVEGAGGLLSPLSWSQTVVELMKELEASALVVASDRLGTISQARLVLAHLRSAGVSVLGVVLSAPATADQSTGGNAATLMRTEPGLRVLELPRCQSLEEAAVRLEPLLGWLS